MPFQWFGLRPGVLVLGGILLACGGAGAEPSPPDSRRLDRIPSGYFEPASQQGSLVELRYTTFESKTYALRKKPLTKRAVVYLPYGYNTKQKYNVLYLMHGGWSNETTTLGTPDRPNGFKNVLDHAVQEHEFGPLIIVCPTYNNESPQDSGDYTLAFYTLAVNYHQELVNDLIPAVDRAYSTNPSRDHRAFGGFSMGSVTTWYAFLNCLDEFRFFLPMSGAMDYEGDDVDAAVTASGHRPQDYFIYAFSGTDDFEFGHFQRQIGGMLSRPSRNFVSTEAQPTGNLTFHVEPGYAHDGRAAMDYTYTGLRWFWRDNS